MKREMRNAKCEVVKNFLILFILLGMVSAAQAKRIDKTEFARELFLRGKIVNVAMSFKGADYRPGSQSREYGFDCSGLTQYVYAACGILIPRKSVTQYKNGVKVRRAALKKGDLVFFNTRGTGPTHVGIYLGAGLFIHAPGIGKKVRIDAIDKRYWKNRWAGAVKYIKNLQFQN